MNLWQRLNRKNRRYHVDPDEIFLDSQNLPNFNTQQFEGVIEKPISKRAILGFGFVLLIGGLIFIARLGFLQVVQGESYYNRSESNYVFNQLLFGDRGIITDRNGEMLAWNRSGEHDEPFSYRDYIDQPGFAHVLGYVRHPKQDSSGVFWRTELEGVAGVEMQSEDTLRGEPGQHMIEVNAQQEVVSSGRLEEAIDGENVRLTIDAGMQTQINKTLAAMSREHGYTGGAGIVMDVTNGELLALTSYPEFSPEVLSLGNDDEAISGYFSDESKPMLNRTLGGVYTPGSIVKPFFALGALNEGVITPNKKIKSTGYIEIPNPYNPSNPSRFYDWRWSRYREGHGMTDVYHAIADSVNTYMYAIGGGYKDQEGIGIAGIEKYAMKFGLVDITGYSDAEKTGLVPTPEWKKETFDDDWRLGDTYNTVIGQFGFQVTPIAMVRAISALANGGDLLRPKIIQTTPTQREHITDIDSQYYDVIREAMRQTVTDGTGSLLNVDYVDIAAKTGTAQTNANRSINAWAVGYWPADEPQYAFVFLAEGASSDTRTGAALVGRRLFDWMRTERPEYVGLPALDNKEDE